MSLSKSEFSSYIRNFEFRKLFNDMGWNNDKTTQPIAIDRTIYALQAVAEKSGFKILVCNPSTSGSIPDYATRKKIESEATKFFQEHLIIFFDKNKTEQIWQFVVRQSGKPTKVTETRWQTKQDPELLFQRTAGIFFKLDEEEKITIIDVKARVGENFQQNNEKVTKAFYDKFKKEHGSFLKFIKGIKDTTEQEWYASLMLNRLMFCYFIQKKGFLDNNKNYLRDKLNDCKTKQGSVKFYSFYRNFLLVLFHQGLNEPTQSPETKIEIGKIPYLNGGLFDEHELEKTHQSIQIDDKAFESLFNFFDQFEWHLDTSATATGKDINPDVIGYIFEKYINDRANMGAYYTKEDITDYISKNCILPYLFDETKRKYPQAFTQQGELWTKVKQSGDRYLYDAVKKGVNLPLPKEIEVGCDDVSKRTEWNKPATDDYALPTEIWREVIDRRKRYLAVKTNIETGEITALNDFITYNLNIRQFTQDVIENTNDPELLKFFHQALNKVTIIDPTCGSGAFLFAAMNILEPLYESCLQRMEIFVAESGRGKHKYFEEILEQVKSPKHPNIQYFIYKTIILNNLYGVDIMKEAVEIAKLRLFLKLVATVEADYTKPNLGLEPLPDVDFNIRAGNTLVGFATEKELQQGLDFTLEGVIAKPLIEEKCEIVSKAFKRYKEIQLTYGDDFKEFKKAKEELNSRLKELNRELNHLLHQQASGIKYDFWLQSHKPFHWFAEFYEIIKEKGGFDVIIGNPPYVVYSEQNVQYKLKQFETQECKDLYAYVIERSIRILKAQGSIGMIVPISIVSTDGFTSLRKIMQTQLKNIWYSNFSMRPAKLFDGVDKHLTIFLSNRIGQQELFSTKYYRWYSDERESLFHQLKYITISKEDYHNDSIPKVSTTHEVNVIRKLKQNQSISVSTLARSKFVVYHTRKLRYFLQFLNTAPIIYEEDGKIRITSELKEIYFKSEKDKLAANATYLSTLFFWYYTTYSDCRNLNKREVVTFPFTLNEVQPSLIEKLATEGEVVLNNLQSNSIFKDATYKKYGKLKMQVFRPRLAKPIIDKIDIILGEHYKFTNEELDFIINYDFKYRVGNNSDEEDLEDE